MGDCLRPVNHLGTLPDQLSLAILRWVGALSTSEGWNVNRHTAQCTIRGLTVLV